MATNSLISPTTAAAKSAPLTIAADTSVVVSLIGPIGSTIAYIRKVGSDASENDIGQLSSHCAAQRVTAGADPLEIVVYKLASDTATGAEADGGAL